MLSACIQKAADSTVRRHSLANGSLAAAFVVLMPTNREQPVESLSAFFVERERPGLEVTRVERKLGQRACPRQKSGSMNCVVSHSTETQSAERSGKTLDLVLGASRCTVAALEREQHSVCCKSVFASATMKM